MAEYWVPKDSFDWGTGGRALSEEEMRILRRLMDDLARERQAKDEDPLRLPS